MRLSLVLWQKMPNGHIFRGKHRFYKEVTPLMIANERRKLTIEDRNMFLLRHPYLTVEEDMGHAKALGKRDQWQKNLAAILPPRLKPHVTLEERFQHLKVGEVWD